MSKELEALKNVKIRCHSKVVWDDPIDFDLEVIKQALLKAQEQEKVLELVNELISKYCTIKLIDGINCQIEVKVIRYGYTFIIFCTQEEFDLLKRYCGR